jgi:beta-mannosidase
VTLQDDWQLQGWVGEEWRWYVDNPWDAPGWLPARVPGSVIDDLVRAGELASPYFERDSRQAEWVAARTWVYRRRLTAGTIRFDGVDHEATVFVDGEEVAHHVGGFTPFEIRLAPGEHVLAVAVHPAPASEPQVGHTSRVRAHKSRMGYGWDFCPRLIHQGIWREVCADEPSRPEYRVSLRDGIGRVHAGDELVLEVADPELWWCNGLGEPRLYEAGDVRVGFRTVELTDDYALIVNGRRTPIRGVNWVPLDVLYGVPRPAKLQRLLELAAGAGVNLVRVWGGGVIESDEFYAHCDQLGILVWQEFSQSSSGLESVPCADPEFVATLAADARGIVPRLAHHPSLAIWGGGNELDADDGHPALAALREVVAELDPDRAWLPTSPLGERDVHGPWEHQGLPAHNRHWDGVRSNLHSEFGVEGMTNREALERLIAPQHRWPADRSNPVYAHLGAWWNNAPLVQECFGGRIEDVETMLRASQWLQYDGLRYAVEATLRRGAGAIPWQLNESFPNAWCTSIVDWHGRPKPAYFGLARAYRGAPSARFPTPAWGGQDEVVARVGAPARLLDLDGRVVATGDTELRAPLSAFAHDVFVLDLDAGANRYVMTRTPDLAPLLDLPPTTLELHDGALRNAGDIIAVGVVCDTDVLDLLPGETRMITGARAEGWNAHL